MGPSSLVGPFPPGKQANTSNLAICAVLSWPGPFSHHPHMAEGGPIFQSCSLIIMIHEPPFGLSAVQPSSSVHASLI
ncbi:hypothetical protein COLO4_12720 [Corchorus olitorius]|uniref:Uncharacterized protein n=1 Tax=Corchorus olitorius TaxID=93759 RepID=A0A1R3K013_9ROSI|nr:hypothetical protein COLO4_12720 [Corchorus olitorius]